MRDRIIGPARLHERGDEPGRQLEPVRIAELSLSQRFFERRDRLIALCVLSWRVVSCLGHWYRSLRPPATA